jgi:hypothetical protein
MLTEARIPEPLLFNPLKHYLPFIREFIGIHITGTSGPEVKKLVRELKHIGTCVMDIYTGSLTQESIFSEILDFLDSNGLSGKKAYRDWAGSDNKSFRIVPLSDSSLWTMKYFEQEARFVHIFPARYSPHTFRIKANTLKSAVLYLSLIGKDYVTEDDLNKARAMAGLSPVREVADTEAVTEMIEILRR